MNELTTEQKANIQRLSDAMRAGAAIRPQATGILFRKQPVNIDNYQKMMICSCALGAAWEGAHPAFDAERWVKVADDGDDGLVGLSDVERYFGLNRRIEAINPHSGLVHEVCGIIIDLNDSRYWTREAIADWLLTLV